MNPKKESITCQRSESDKLRLILLHEPNDDVLLSMSHPAGALFEKPFSFENSVRDHKNFQMALEERGCKVILLKDIFENCDTPSKREILENSVMEALIYKWADDCGDTEGQESYISDDYKRKVIKEASNHQLTSYLFLRPKVYLSMDPKNTGVSIKHISCQPLGNLVFTRDQQITTPCGIVIGRMSNHQRNYETFVLKTAWNILEHSNITIPKVNHSVGNTSSNDIEVKIRLIGEIPFPYTLEGGDYLQQSNLSLCGVGYRSVEASNLFLMKKGLLCRCESGSCKPMGLLTEKEKSRPYYHAVVRDGFDHNQERIHLDCILAFINESTAIIDETILEDKRRTRYVDVYECNHDAPSNEYTGSFKLIQCQVPLESFLAEHNIKLIRISHDLQLKYGVNVLSCGNGMIVGVCKEATDYVNSIIELDEKLKDHVHCNFVEFGGVTSMYGSVHCATQAIYREPTSMSDEESFEKGEIKEIVDLPFSHINMKPFEFYAVLNVPSNLSKSDLISQTNDGGLSSQENCLMNIQNDLIEEIYYVFKRLMDNDVKTRFELHPFSIPYNEVLAGKNIVSLGNKVFVSKKLETLASFVEHYEKGIKMCEVIDASKELGNSSLKNSAFVLKGKIMCSGSEDYEVLAKVFNEDKVARLPEEDKGTYTVVNGILVFEEGSDLPDCVSSLTRRIGVSIPLHRQIFKVGIRDILAGL